MAWKREETSTVVVGWDMTRASDGGGAGDKAEDECDHWEEPKRAHTASWPRSQSGPMIDAQMG